MSSVSDIQTSPDRTGGAVASHVKVTRVDWLNKARETLIRDGVGGVKILPLAAELGVSRSSFYWYFKNRADLLNALLSEWEDQNTDVIVRHCAFAADSITEACCNFFRCFVGDGLFDPGLDFAVRGWARHDEDVRARIEQADARRIRALSEMFTRHAFGPEDADARARIVYFMQLGYHALDQREDIETRMGRVRPYLRGFTGLDASDHEVAELEAFARKAGAMA